MNLADFRTDRNGKPYGLKKCKYHCDYGDGEYCHYKEHDGCIYNKRQDGQFKGRRMTDAESMGILFDDPPDVPYDVFVKKVIECMFKYMNVIGKTFALNVMIKNVGTQEN